MCTLILLILNQSVASSLPQLLGQIYRHPSFQLIQWRLASSGLLCGLDAGTYWFLDWKCRLQCGRRFWADRLKAWGWLVELADLLREEN